MKIEVGHVCIEVGDFSRAIKFYRPLFRTTGFKKLMGGKGWAGYSNGKLSIFISKAKPRRVVRRRPTGQEFVVADHIAFNLASRRQVNLVAKTLEKAGFKAVFPAQVYPEFGPNFYAVSFRDPDNYVLEFSCRK
jgi:catechol 2,3-dioxygenase-like lactoylglutathione lyase family enzyme